uniref:hypothetical protein n=1 Tax=Actinoplanes sp. CA-084688 TaxID=3239901 RepID=UPI003F490F38
MRKTAHAKADKLLRVLQSDPDVELMSTQRLTRAQRRSMQEIPWSSGPRTRGQRIARSLWG